MREDVAHITCECGQIFQVLKDDGESWDEQATAQAYQQHVSEAHNQTT